MSASETPWQANGELKWSMEWRGVRSGFVAAAAILVFVGCESYRYTVRVDEAAEAQKHSYEAQLAPDEVAERLVDAETGQRGYLLTGDETYLRTTVAPVVGQFINCSGVSLGLATAQEAKLR